ncbi:MAG: hypothetical protein WDW38_002513 [Sanguina aurantia]
MKAFLEHLQAVLQSLKLKHGKSLALRKSTSTASNTPFPIRLTLTLEPPEEASNYDVGALLLHITLSLPPQLDSGSEHATSSSSSSSSSSSTAASLHTHSLQQLGVEISVQGADLAPRLQQLITSSVTAQAALKVSSAAATATAGADPVEKELVACISACILHTIACVQRDFVPLITSLPDLVEHYQSVDASGATVRRHALINTADASSDTTPAQAPPPPPQPTAKTRFSEQDAPHRATDPVALPDNPDPRQPAEQHQHSDGEDVDQSDVIIPLAVAAKEITFLSKRYGKMFRPRCHAPPPPPTCLHPSASYPTSSNAAAGVQPPSSMLQPGELTSFELDLEPTDPDWEYPAIKIVGQLLPCSAPVTPDPSSSVTITTATTTNSSSSSKDPDNPTHKTHAPANNGSGGGYVRGSGFNSAAVASSGSHSSGASYLVSLGASMMGHMRAALAGGDQTPLRGAFKRLENYAGEVAREAQEKAARQWTPSGSECSDNGDGSGSDDEDNEAFDEDGYAQGGERATAAAAAASSSRRRNPDGVDEGCDDDGDDAGEEEGVDEVSFHGGGEGGGEGGSSSSGPPAYTVVLDSLALEGIAVAEVLQAHFQLVCSRCSHPILVILSGSAISNTTPTPTAPPTHSHAAPAAAAPTAAPTLDQSARTDNCSYITHGAGPADAVGGSGSSGSRDEVALTGAAGKAARKAAGGPRPFEQQGACGNCHASWLIVMRPRFVHESANVLGVLKPLGVTPRDLLPSLWAGQCGTCSGVMSMRAVQVGVRFQRSCSNCHRELALHMPCVSFLPLRLNLDTIRAQAAARRPQTRLPGGGGGGSLLLQPGQPLPAMGTCKHYRHSYRWLRFPCCGMRFACDLCHELASDHEMRWAVRMACGFCSLEQSVADVCKGCGKKLARSASNVTGKVTHFWEGGLGCRDPSKMNRNDPHRWRSRNKTVSAKHTRVGPKAWSKEVKKLDAIKAANSAAGKAKAED